jgi:xanthine dehydrogenase molybdenum-binding subunit
MAYKLLGHNFVPPDVRAKVTGEAKYAEDFTAEGMLHAKLLLSPMPHARVRHVDTSKAMAMDGVVAILTADEVPAQPPPANPILTNPPHYVGEPIMAVAAESEEIAAAAIEAIQMDLEQLKFETDPLDSLYPGGANAREDGNVANVRLDLQTVKWSAGDFVDPKKLPMGPAPEEWSYGDLEAGFAKAKVVVEDSFVTAGTSHHSMEPRSALAYWQNGKCYVHGSAQSQSFITPGIAGYIGIQPSQLVWVGEFCGGGFGSKGGAYPLPAIPALLSKKANRPVMMRVSREEEYYVGSGRPGFQGWAKIGFAEDGRITAADIYVVQDNGPNIGFGDFRNAGHAVSVVYQPEAMRWQGIPVLTNTPPRGPQRGPGENQTALAIEPLIDKGARMLGMDRLAIRRLNAPDKDGKEGEKQGPMTSAYLKNALDQGAKLFNWEEKKKLSGQRNGTKVTGVGIGQAFHAGGSSGFDGLLVILPNGKLSIHTGVGNLGTYSYAGTSRVAAEVLGYNWDNVEIVRGRTDRNLPWNLGQFGSNTSHTMSRTNYVAAMDAKQKLLEIAATDLGGAPEDYDLQNESVVSKSDPSKSMTFAAAAKRAIELGGKYSGKEAPEDINPMTRASVEALAGSGLVGVAKDNLPKPGLTPALAAGFVRVEIDVETGDLTIMEYVGVADCGTVIHPQSLATQIFGASTMGFGLGRTERIAYDPALGVAANVGYDQAKPLTYLDVPVDVKWGAVDQPDSVGAFGTKGIGEPLMGCAGSALVCAISDALGGHYFNRTPVIRDMIINALADQPQSHGPLQQNVM